MHARSAKSPRDSEDPHSAMLYPSMSFTHQLRFGGGYSLDTHIRLQSPFKVRVMKLTKKTTTKLSSAKTEKTSDGARLHVSPPSAMKSRTGVVRQGAVRVKQCGLHPRNWFFKTQWLVLSEKQLSVYPSEVCPFPFDD